MEMAVWKEGRAEGELDEGDGSSGSGRSSGMEMEVGSDWERRDKEFWVLR